MTAGYNEFWASMTWVRLQVYSGSSKQNRSRGYTQLGLMLDSALALDPKFREAYVFGGRHLTHRSDSTMATRKEYLQQASYLERGIVEFPEDAALREHLANLYAYGLVPESKEEKRQNFERAIELVEEAMDFSGADVGRLVDLSVAYKLSLSGEDSVAANQIRLEACQTRAVHEKNSQARKNIYRECQKIAESLGQGEAIQEDPTFGSWERDYPFEKNVDIVILLGQDDSRWRTTSTY